MPKRSRRIRSRRANLLCNGMPTFDEIGNVFLDEEEALKYLVEKNVLSAPICVRCGATCKPTGKKFMYACRPCGFNRSILKGTFFENTKLPLGKAVRVIYCWMNQLSVKSTRKETGISHNVVSNWFANLRLLVSCVVVNSDLKIGGEGKTVQIDESKFGKRKKARNGRGHRVEGIWVFGGVEKGGNAQYGNNKYFAMGVPDRTAATLLPIIKK